MRSTRILKWGVLAAMCTTLVVVLAGCPKHENSPTELDLVEAAAPDSFRVTSNGINTSGEYEYDLRWWVTDATNVKSYRLYLVGASFAPELVHTTTPDETSDLFLPVKLPSNGQGLQFGLSTVSTGNVESGMKVATIPPVSGTQ